MEHNKFFLSFFIIGDFDMAIADQPNHTIQPTPTIPKALRGFGLLGFFAAIAIAAALVQFTPGGLATQLDPSQLVGP